MIFQTFTKMLENAQKLKKEPSMEFHCNKKKIRISVEPRKSKIVISDFGRNHKILNPDFGFRMNPKNLKSGFYFNRHHITINIWVMPSPRLCFTATRKNMDFEWAWNEPRISEFRNPDFWFQLNHYGSGAQLLFIFYNISQITMFSSIILIITLAIE